MIRTRAITALSAAALAVAGYGVFGAVTASASTASCTAGAFAGYCGTQVDAESSPLAMVAAGQAAAYNNHVNAYPNTTDDAGNDFVNLAYKGDNTLGVEFMYAPNGVPSGLCASDPVGGGVPATAARDGLVLRWCNGSAFQRWVAAPAATGYTWKNVASGLIMQANGRSQQLTDVTAPVALLPTQEWTFAG